MRLFTQILNKRFVTTLSPNKITEILSANELYLDKNVLPACIKSIECNQLASNNPIEDRLRISAMHLPGFKEPSLILGCFDGHGGGTTADLISRRLFNYIALALHPKPSRLQISNYDRFKDIVVDLHNSPKPYDDPQLLAMELNMLNSYNEELMSSPLAGELSPTDIVASLKNSFQRCDADLSKEIQDNLISPLSSDQHTLRHYLSAAVSGCCAIIMVIHQGFAYLASTGDCRAVLGVHRACNQSPSRSEYPPKIDLPKRPETFRALELNDEHNCDNINEIRRLAASHPKSEQNTMIKHNRLLGHLMPFRAFGDFNYKWPADIIKACGVTRAFGSGVIPSNYETPPYLIVEPDVRILQVDDKGYDERATNGDYRESNKEADEDNNVRENKYLIMATDGLWELFESSRDVVEAIVDHSNSSSQDGVQDDYDLNCATYILRSALRFGPHQDIGLDPERLKRLHHIRLESSLTLPRSVVRNFRDDISIILLKLR